MAEASAAFPPPGRATRLHDEGGRRIPVSRLLRNGPRALLSGVLVRSLGYRAEVPWISYDARAVIGRHLGPSSSVLEFGSGMSTLWYARHAGSVLSLETSEDWHRKVSAAIARAGLDNIDYRACPGLRGYPDAACEDPGRRFDLIMVDGPRRDLCLECALPLLAPGGIVYVDNADKQKGGRSGNVPRAVEIALDFAAENGLAATFFTDFAPGQFFVESGLMIHSEGLS